MTFETEKGFMQAVIDLARLNGWLVYHTHKSQRSAKGFPDLTMVRDGVLIFAELKTEKGKMTAAQEEWKDALEDVEAATTEIKDHLGYVLDVLCNNVLYYAWRPSDWPEIELILQRPTE